MRANFQACNASDESWNRRWGQYLVAFDRDEAFRICRERSWYGAPAEPELMSCKVNGHYVLAGYFCQESYS
jgi:hypothetical protein